MFNCSSYLGRLNISNNNPNLTKLLKILDRKIFNFYRWKLFFQEAIRIIIENRKNNPKLIKSFYFYFVITSIFNLAAALISLKVNIIIISFIWHSLIALWIYNHLSLIRNENNINYKSFLLSNFFTYFRFSLSISSLNFLYLGNSHNIFKYIYISIILVLIITDFLDGFFARVLSQKSRLGLFMDPMADLSLILFLSIALFINGNISLYLFLIIILRYPITLIIIFILYFKVGEINFNSTWVGKITNASVMVFLMSNTIFLILKPGLLNQTILFYSSITITSVIFLNILFLTIKLFSFLKK